MKLIFVSFLIALSACSTIQDLTNPKRIGSLKAGDSVILVENEIGYPRSTRTIDNYRFYEYWDGIVVFRDNSVIDVMKNSNKNLRFGVNVDFLSADSDFNTVKIFSGMPNVKEGSLEFAEMARGLAFVLRSNGFQITDDENEANIFLTASFGISDPNVDYKTYSVPIFGYDGGSTSYSTFNANASSYSSPYSTSITGSSSTYTSGKGTYLQGFSSNTVKQVSYDRILILKALDAQKYREGEEQEVWITRAKSSGYSANIRQVLPALLASVKPYIDKHGDQRYVEVKEASLDYMITKYFLSPSRNLLAN